MVKRGRFSCAPLSLLSRMKRIPLITSGTAVLPPHALLTVAAWVRYGHGSGRIYRLCEAKFCAETATGVGRATTVMVFGANGRMRQLTYPGTSLRAAINFGPR